MKPSKKNPKSKIQNPKVIIILGPPGSGKGTQAELLCKKFDLESFGAGDTLRQRQKIRDFTGKKLKEVMEKGELVPNLIVSELWMEVLEKFKRKRKFNGVVSEGNPRRIIEAQLFDEALNWYEWQKNVKVFLINISKKESFNRLTKRRECKKCDKCGGKLIIRIDDKPKAIKKRWEEFKEKTIPVINYFKKQGKLVKINGEQSIEKVFQDILKALKF